MYNYRIYPSLLDKFQDYLDYQIQAEMPWNKVSEAAHNRGEYLDKAVGDYILSPDEVAERIEVELINSINRCPKEPNEAADAGTCFNEVVDCLIHKRKPLNDDIKVQTLRREDGTPVCIEARLNGFTFNFDIALCRQMAEYYRGALSQYMLSAPIDTQHGKVELYGYADEWLGDSIFDIKTTSAYDFPKFERKTQRLVYPYCAIKSGFVADIDYFEYTVIKWCKNNRDVIYKPRTYSDGVDNTNDYERLEPHEITIWRGDMYQEIYSYTHDVDTERLRLIVERFIEWLEYRREYITDSKIFGGENSENYQGTKIENL